jgi:hypothetical protein
MRTLPLAGIIAALLFIGVLSVHAQEIADHVVINEIDTNPPGDDAKSISEWVELYNPTSEDVDIGGWKIASTTVAKKTLTIPAGATIKAGQFIVYSYTTLWFPDVSEKVQLMDAEGKIVDETPRITDKENNFSSWQRKFDAVDSDTSNDWVFRTSSAGSSNGKLQSAVGEYGELIVSVKADKKNYVFGDTAVITGNVSKRIYQEKPYFTQAHLTVHIDGPGQSDIKRTLYPDKNLQFKTEMKLDKVRGIGAGTYTVTASYAGSDDTTLFVVGDKQVIAEEKQESELVISTDKPSYIPGQSVKISASTTQIIPLEGLRYEVYDAKNIRIFSGKLYPTPDGKFSGQVFMTTIKPVYGTYDIIADYGKQHAETTFELFEDIKDAENIVLTTDKKAYGLGETIIISGRSNKYVVALDVEVLQTGVTAIGKDTKNVFKIRDQVTLAGDSTFRYELKIPSGQERLGDYRVTISKEFGKAITYFKIVEDPDKYVPTKDDNFVSTDKANYSPGEKITISGHVTPKTRTSYEAIPVKISITDENGKALSIVAKDKKLRVRDDSTIATYGFTTIPDTTGNYKIETTLNPSTFKTGVYFIKATYDDLVSTAMFSVEGKIDTTNTKISAKTDKQVYGLDEKVTLEGTLLTGQSSVKITLTRPDGKTINAGARVDDGKFSWSWTTPQKEYSLADIRDPRQARPSVFGNYKISIMATSETIDVFFKVSENPEADKLEIKPLEVKAEKQSYAPGEKLKVTGSAIKRQQSSTSTGGVVPDRVTVQVKSLNNKVIYDSKIDLDNAGHFEVTYDMPLTVFKDGQYKITAIYQTLRADAMFEVKSGIPSGDTGKLAITLNTDKEEYSPGETIRISGMTNKVVSIGKLDLVVIPEESTKINCGNFYCGLGGKKIDLTRYYNNGLYQYDYVLPSNVALGNYVVKADTEFGIFTKTFKVVEKKPQTELKTISEKVNRITDAVTEVGLYAQTMGGKTVVPILLQGSVVTPRGSEKDVNLMITTEDGHCIIGQDVECAVTKSTKNLKGGYEIAIIGAQRYKVTYSGHLPLLEKFSIAPESAYDSIPDSVWTLEVVRKQGTISKLYYELVYKEVQ